MLSAQQQSGSSAAVKYSSSAFLVASHPLLTSLASNNPFVASHALLDLLYLTHYAPERRAFFFMPPNNAHNTASSNTTASSWDDGNDLPSLASCPPLADATSAWDFLSSYTVQFLLKTCDQLEKAMAKQQDKKPAGGGKVKQSTSAKQGSPVPPAATTSQPIQAEVKRRSTSLLSTLLSSLSAFGASSRRLDSLVRQVFKDVTPEEVDLSLSASLSTFRASPALLQLQIQLVTLVKAVSRLMAHSVYEDALGVLATSKRIPRLLNVFLKLHLLLQEYAALAASTALSTSGTQAKRAPGSWASPALATLLPSFTTPSVSRLATSARDDVNLLAGHMLTQSFTSAALAAVGESIYQLTTTYYEHLQNYAFPSAHVELLQRFMDFTA